MSEPWVGFAIGGDYPGIQELKEIQSEGLAEEAFEGSYHHDNIAGGPSGHMVWGIPDPG